MEVRGHKGKHKSDNRPLSWFNSNRHYVASSKVIKVTEKVLSWVSERLGVAMKQARFGLDKSWVIDLELAA